LSGIIFGSINGFAHAELRVGVDLELNLKIKEKYFLRFPGQSIPRYNPLPYQYGAHACS
jgi:hypothetical protein